MKKQASELFDKTLGPMPDHIRDLPDSIQNIPDPPYSPEQQNTWERAPIHMVDDGEEPSLNEDALRNLSRKAASARTNEAEERANDLKRKYPKYWGRRGGAGMIARLEKDDPISERTVRELFKKK